ncbi:MAG: hypothetical protein H6829_12010 [Planctomycetes bacterium]|nr:hypothetical protein [Planctomycetota bacterium]HPF13579.1 hypothetical protein [Planctomycetota bacterium]HRV80650.1 hypothetical protein [Planctomycetota bacterium]
MQDFSFLIDLTIGLAAVAAPALWATRGGLGRARWAAAVHPLLALGLFYSLAGHVHQRLGGWPEQIGTDGFPAILVNHTELAWHAFGSLILGLLIGLPLLALGSFTLPNLRQARPVLACYALVGLAAMVAMQCAPEAYLYWWWD